MEGFGDGKLGLALSELIGDGAEEDERRGAMPELGGNVLAHFLAKAFVTAGGDEIVCYLHSGVKVSLLTGMNVRDNEAVERPSLTARPRRTLCITLSAIGGYKLTGFSVVLRLMCNRAVGTDVMSNGSVSVCHSKSSVSVITGNIGCPVKYSKIHHTVDDRPVAHALLTVPSLDKVRTDNESAHKSSCCKEASLFGILIARKTVLCAAGKVPKETNVVMEHHHIVTEGIVKKSF